MSAHPTLGRILKDLRSHRGNRRYQAGARRLRCRRGGGSAAGGSSVQQGGYDTTPVFALDGTKLKTADASSPATQKQNPPLSVPALLAVILLVAVVAGLVMVLRVRRATERTR